MLKRRRDNERSEHRDRRTHAARKISKEKKCQANVFDIGYLLRLTNDRALYISLSFWPVVFVSDMHITRAYKLVTFRPGVLLCFFVRNWNG